MPATSQTDTRPLPYWLSHGRNKIKIGEVRGGNQYGSTIHLAIFSLCLCALVPRLPVQQVADRRAVICSFESVSALVFLSFN